MPTCYFFCGLPAQLASGGDELQVAPGSGWASVLPQDQSVALFKEAMTLLLQHGLRVEELAAVAGPDASAIETTATEVEEDREDYEDLRPEDDPPLAEDYQELRPEDDPCRWSAGLATWRRNMLLVPLTRSIWRPPTVALQDSSQQRTEPNARQIHFAFDARCCYGQYTAKIVIFPGPLSV